MKKTMKIMFAAAAMAVLMIFPSQAAGKNAEYREERARFKEARAEYREEKAEIREEIQKFEAKIAELREENKAISEKYAAVRQEKRETGNLRIDKKNWKEARALRAEIREIGQAGKIKDKTICDPLRAEAKALAAEGKFEDAEEKLEGIIDVKEAHLERVKKMNKLWKQIEVLLK